ncbi:hypothetical protein CLU79DRAFT_717201 [Phycomyces nitens]|nr:hypothetical protein CLU79DRAFT_717201 [Phycomyces nitens]
MSFSVSEVLEDFVESLQNLPAEMDQTMRDLRGMDEDFQGYSETYSKHRRMYSKQLKQSNVNPSSSIDLVAARLQLERDYKKALHKQDQKIELALQMYELVSRHIERMDAHIMANGIDSSGWSRDAKPAVWDDDWQVISRKRTIGPSIQRKRTNSVRRPSLSLHHTLAPRQEHIDPNEPTYCYCNQVAFGDMVACDGENCEKEWFHYACVGLVEPPAGKWFCNDCTEDSRSRYSAY